MLQVVHQLESDLNWEWRCEMGTWIQMRDPIDLLLLIPKKHVRLDNHLRTLPRSNRHQYLWIQSQPLLIHRAFFPMSRNHYKPQMIPKMM
jgi:hypothetical protein